MADKWAQFKAVKGFSDAWASAGAQALTGAAGGLYDTIKAAVEGEPLQPKQALELGPGMLLPAFGRAVSAVGAAGGKLPQGWKVIESMAPEMRQGLTEARAALEAARAEQAASLQRLDSAAEHGHSRYQTFVDGYRQTEKTVAQREAELLELLQKASAKGSSVELGAMGGSGKQGAITVEDVRKIVDELGLAHRVKGSSGGTSYVKVHDPQGDPTKVMEVRVPHPDIPHGGKPKPHMIDTSTEGTQHLSRSQQNLAGETYAGNPDAVRDRLGYAFGRAPGSAPAAAPEAAPVDPRQLKLLSGGIPVPASVWDQFERAQ
jgi:pyruvate/2-oxoglutarate dehydrogenase complex dihydrolipoamide acyltransferase (E2) component